MKKPAQNRTGLPRAGMWILKRFLCEDEYQEKLGDFEEGWRIECEQNGNRAGMKWFWIQLLTATPKFLKNKLYWRGIMLRNYLKIGMRHLRKHKVFSLINIIGLAVGMAGCIFIFQWVADELSYDGFHRNKDDIYRVVIRETVQGMDRGFAVSHIPLAPALKADLPEIIQAARINYWRLRFKWNDTSASEFGILTDSDFLHMFTFPLLAGDPETALADPFSIIMTESTAEKYFGRQNPLGRTMSTLDGSDFLVTGIIADPPRRSHLRFDFILPFAILARTGKDLNNWDDVSYFTYIRLAKGISPESAESKIDASIRKYKADHLENARMCLQNLGSIHLRSDFKFDIGGHGDIRYIYIFSSIGLFILFIACINFMNLSTARSAIRAKEVGIRKAVGADRRDLIRQFFQESVLLGFFSLAVSLVLVRSFQPAFNSLAGRELEFNPFGHWELFLGLMLGAVLIGCLAGSYPALYLSSFHPVNTLRGKLWGIRPKGALRRFLVIAQFTLSALLIVGTLVVFRQVEFMQNKNLGFEKNHLVYFPMFGKFRSSYKSIKGELKQNPGIISVSVVDTLPIHEGSGTSGAAWEGKPDELRLQMRVGSVDEDFLDAFQLEMAMGRFFSRKYPSDSQNAVVLNETAVRAMGLKDPVGKRFSISNFEGRIIGVIKDFQLRSLHYAIDPLFLILRPGWYYNMCVRIDSKNIPDTLGFLEATWKKYSPEYPIQFRFLDEAVDELYRNDRRVSMISNVFSLLAVFVSCLGLFGLSSFTAERRTKEIGIRKILGASIAGIWMLISKEFIRWVLLANLIAWPIAYLVMREWLKNFAFRTGISFWIFIFTGVLLLAMAVLTMSVQIIKSARANPADSLQQE